MDHQVFEPVGRRFAGAGQSAHGQVVEGVAREHAADHAEGGEHVEAGELDPLQFKQFQGLVLGDAPGLDVLLVPRPQHLAETARGHARQGVLV
ncbi:hypothetical protein DSECCO2_638780 [anaerobic digester metagenome]